MASSAPPSLPGEYIRLYDLPAPSTLPTELRGKVLFTRNNFVHGQPGGGDSGSKPGPSGGQHASGNELLRTTGNAGGRGAGTGFNFSKALKGALDGAGSSVHGRGDGKFADGRDFAVSDAPGGRAKFVHLTPDALAPDNADKTLQELDRLQQLAKPVPKPSTSSTTAAPTAQSRSTQLKNAAALAAAAKVLYDISDDDAATTSGTYTAAAASAVAAGHATPAAAATPSATAAATDTGALRVPEYSLREIASSDGPMGQGQAGSQGQLEVSVLLPDVVSPSEVDVWLGGSGCELQVAVSGKYHLKLALPCRVLDDTSKAKWSKVKRRLTLTLTKDTRGR
ncbi:hypothetical protein Agub_g3988 [Astrephomene gubernaculifera]|uniref:PIH1D1/2/3 CS-like domain-containing protein n=1 Tax=Astrephomene gubernaculifera TaxID=47775 RepID=A0AAD3DJI1_9CHLO|nr:hypothetical protein Agub_g3988 [Astrephomene gubernaculifera]